MATYSYFATCPAGLETEASRLLALTLPASEVTRCCGGAVWFNLPEALSPQRIPEFVTNVFFVIRSWNTSSAPFAELVKQAGKKSGLSSLPEGYAPETFRLRFSRENRFESVDKAVSRAAEGYIAAAAGGLTDRDGEGGEYWFIIRREDWSAFALRLPQPKRSEISLAQGELAPSLASLLVLRVIRDRNPRVILDPCAGHGAIPERCLRLFPGARVISCDADAKAAAALAERFSESGRATVRQSDLRDLSWIETGSVDAVITDPPWGMWEEGGYRDPEALRDLYRGLLASAARILVPGGRLGVLTGAKREFEEALASDLRFSSPDAEKRTDLLVNGKKAALYVLEASPPSASRSISV